MKISMRKCDNPACRTTAYPESESKPYVAPYGWIRLSGDRVGLGPRIKVEVCSVECVAPAIAELIDEDERR